MRKRRGGRGRNKGINIVRAPLPEQVIDVGSENPASPELAPFMVLPPYLRTSVDPPTPAAVEDVIESVRRTRSDLQTTEQRHVPAPPQQSSIFPPVQHPAIYAPSQPPLIIPPTRPTCSYTSVQHISIPPVLPDPTVNYHPTPSGLVPNLVPQSGIPPVTYILLPRNANETTYTAAAPRLACPPAQQLYHPYNRFPTVSAVSGN